MLISPLTRLALMAGAMMLPAAVALAQDAPEEQDARRALHQEQAKLAAQQTRERAAQRAVIADEQAARELTYREALAAREAQIAETRARAAEDRAKWEAAVTACLAGDHSQCAQPAVPAVE